MIGRLGGQWVWFAGEVRDSKGDFGDGGGGVDTGHSPTCLAVTGEFPGHSGAVVALDPGDGGVTQPVDGDPVGEHPGQVLTETFEQVVVAAAGNRFAVPRPQQWTRGGRAALFGVAVQGLHEGR